ncbi:Nse1 non-SMC component of SMC5-6 complex-domain-containing protein [Lophiotrema nucula]|uniref:Non-structural maintenance of chromosomes element 1 homolog n=1 Tax=Lophiotrema nucula TaxID=690887 RepID=A0A6A5ZAV9_9PLEO|nr:Nse1 non-SMC component of SMC5-6 complex-domain-containing protein [Lophiotrema nucula]
MSDEEIRAEEDVGGYNHAHRAFLQAFLSRSVMTVDEIKPILANIMSAYEGRPRLEGDITEMDITSMIQMVNSRLQALDYDIRAAHSQTSRELVYALVNTQSDPLTQLATTFTPDEIAYIKRLLDAMFETNNTRRAEIMAVDSIQASQLAKVARNRQSQVNGHTQHDDEDQPQESQVAVKGITIAEAEKVCASLVSQQFCAKSRKGYYSLAPRALLELRAYLKETYNEPADPDDEEDEGITRIRDCEGCGTIVTYGQRCSNRDCGCRLHDHCMAQFFRGRNNGERKCPACKAPWPGDFFVGERAATQGQRRTTGGRRANGGRGQVYDDDDDEEE